jgi:hypothetical protein
MWVSVPRNKTDFFSEAQSVSTMLSVKFMLCILEIIIAVLVYLKNSDKDLKCQGSLVYVSSSIIHKMILDIGKLGAVLIKILHWFLFIHFTLKH